MLTAIVGINWGVEGPPPLYKRYLSPLPHYQPYRKDH